MAEFEINDSNWKDFAAPQKVNGELMGRGLIPRDFSARPYGSIFGLPAMALPEFTDEEIEDRIADQERHKSSLFHMRADYGIKSLNQANYPYCHTADTEVLTEKGWIGWPDYNGSDLLGTVEPTTGLLEFQSPFTRQILPYDGEIIYSTNRRIDFGVTPNHRMMVRKWDESKRTLSDRFTFQHAGEIGWYVGLPHSPRGFIGTELERLSIDGDREYLGDDFFAMLAVITSDGYVTESERHTGQVGFCCFNEQRYPMIAALANRIGFKEVPSRKGVWARYSAHALASWLKANCYIGGNYIATNKRVPDIVKVASVRQIAHFINYFGDKSHTREDASLFYSSSKRMIDDLQELHLRIGKRGTITREDATQSTIRATGVTINSRERFRLTISQTDRLCIERKKHIEQDHYKGLVYCATVPNGTLVTRRNGSVLISGNCWAFSTTKAIMYLNARANNPVEELSGWMLGSVASNFVKTGGFCEYSLQAAREVGVCSLAEWQQGGVSRSLWNATTKEQAAKRKVLEWSDMPNDDRNTRILASLLLMNIPVMTEYNWWGHSVCAFYLRAWKKKPFAYDIDNSWTPDWGNDGCSTLTGSKAVPDNMGCPFVVG